MHRLEQPQPWALFHSIETPMTPFPWHIAKMHALFIIISEQFLNQKLIYSM